MKDTRAKATHFTAVGPQMGEKDIKLKTVVVSEPPKICLKCPDSKSHMHRLCTYRCVVTSAAATSSALMTQRFCDIKVKASRYWRNVTM